MRDCGTIVRKSFYDVLNGQILSPEDGTTIIPVVDQKLDDNITDHDLYILLGAQVEPDPSVKVKSYWSHEIDLNILVVNRRKSTSSKLLIEGITEQILEIIFPERHRFGITIPSPFKLSYVKKVSSEYAFNKIEFGWEISKQTIFKTRITQ